MSEKIVNPGNKNNQKLRQFRDKLVNQVKKDHIHIAADFNATKDKPLVEHGWKVWINHNGKLVTIPDEPESEGKLKAHVFNLDKGDLPGVLVIVNRPNVRYAYYRSDRFQEFLDAHKINRVKFTDPSGYYLGRSGTYKGKEETISIAASPGTTIQPIASVGNIPEDEVLVDANYASAGFHVTGANFVIFQQRVTRDDVGNDGELLGKTTYTIRHLVTNQDIFSLENEISSAIAANLNSQ